MTAESLDRTGTTWAIFFARSALGLMALMPGYHKVFVMGPMGHAEQFFLNGFEETWIPGFLLLALGVAIPFLELLIGLLLVSGFRTRPALLMEGFLLLVVTYGHFLQVPLFDTSAHIFPRMVLLVVVLVLPRSMDGLSVDGLLARRKG